MRFVSLICLVVLVSSNLDNNVQSLATGSTNKKKNKSSGSSAGAGFGSTTKNSFTHIPDTSETILRLIEFLQSNKSKGIQEIVEIGLDNSDNDDGTNRRGLFAVKNIKKGKMICQIPSNCALALSDPKLGGKDIPTPAHAGSNFLSMYWNNKEAKSIWSPYLDTLPTSSSSQFDKTPIFFNDDELELLEFPRLIRQAKERKEQISKLAIETNQDVNELQFATWMTSSRAFPIAMMADDDDDNNDTNNDEDEDTTTTTTGQLDDHGRVITKAKETKKIPIMVPFIDMANHSSDQPNAQLTVLDPEKDDAWFALEALRPIKAGKEILISYGSGIDSSVELFLNYGFIPKSNRIDEFMLKKGGEECLTSVSDWTTSLEEDEAMLPMAQKDETLKKILNFRVQLKKSYPK